jgi:hypothetical protein
LDDGSNSDVSDDMMMIMMMMMISCPETLLTHLRFEVLTAVVVRISLFWDITPCSPLKCQKNFGKCHYASIIRVEL